MSLLPYHGCLPDSGDTWHKRKIEHTSTETHNQPTHTNTFTHKHSHASSHTPVVTCVFVRIFAATVFFTENSRFIKVCTHTAISNHEYIRLCNQTLSISDPRRASQGVMSHKLMSHVTHVDGLSLPRHEESDETS